MTMRKDFATDRTGHFDRRRYLWVAAALAAGAIAGLGLDTSVARVLVVDRLPGDIRRFLGLTEFFAHGAGVVVITWFIWQTSKASRRMLPRLLACAFLPGLAVNAVKLTVCRFRPAYFGERLPATIWDSWVAGPMAAASTRGEFGTYFVSSFPSGHAATAFGLAIGLTWLFPPGRTPFFALAVLSTIQRMSGGAHWLSDTLTGAALAVLIAGSLTSPSWLSRRFDRWEARGGAVSDRRLERNAA